MATKATKSTPKPPAADKVAEDEVRHEDSHDGHVHVAPKAPEKPEPKPGEPEYDWTPLYAEGTAL